MRQQGAAVILALAGLLGATAAPAQEALCADPGGYCGKLIESQCLARVGAGVLATAEAEGDCGAQLEAYRLCVLAASQCGSETGAFTSQEGCGAEAEREFWEIAEGMGDCGGFTAFLETCPKASRAPFARAKIAALDCSESGAERSAAASTPDLGRFQDCDACPEMVALPAGSFVMGENDAYGRTAEHPVRLKRFALARTETTFAQWEACVAGGGCGGYWPDDRGFGRGERPVIEVSWLDAQRYVDWLNRQVEGAPYRLPSEAEWEYAARAGGGPEVPWSAAEARSRLNYGEEACCGGKGAADGRDRWVETAPVGSFPPNAFGLHDMLGNVSELVQDCYNYGYGGAPTDGSAWMAGECDKNMFRGGSWRAYREQANPIVRFFFDRTSKNWSYGFRVARDLPAR